MAFSSPYSFSNDFQIELSTPVVADLAMWCHGELSFPSFQHEEVYVPNVASLPECDHMVESSESMTLFPKHLDVTCISSDHHHHYQLFEDERRSTGLVSYFSPLYPQANDNFESNEKSDKGLEGPTVKVGKYSVEEKKDKIMKYLKKRNQRNFNKTIKYACRKTLADKRIRVRGRFAKNNEPYELVNKDDEAPRKNNYQNPHLEEEPAELLYDSRNNFQMKDCDEEEDWLEEAMATLMYSPYIH